MYSSNFIFVGIKKTFKKNHKVSMIMEPKFRYEKRDIMSGMSFIFLDLSNLIYNN